MKQLWAPWRMSYLQGDHQPVEGCLFCHKLLLEEDAKEHILYRGETAFVVLNRYPYSNGHMMVAPFAHIGALEQIAPECVAEMMALAQHGLRFLGQVYHPHGFNIGINQGAAAGAGVAEHIHLHIVPRWAGDANYMTVIGETRVIPQSLDDTYAIFRPLFDALKPAP